MKNDVDGSAFADHDVVAAAGVCIGTAMPRKSDTVRRFTTEAEERA